ncbi:MAG: M56 family metallopeptidase, partial [Myxococcota bacterium]
MTGAVPVEPVALALAHGCWFLPALDAVGRAALAPAGRVRLREGGWLVWAAGVLTSPWHAQPVGLDVWVPGPWLLALGLPGLWGVARWLASWWALRRLPTEPAGTFRGVRVEVGAASVPLTWGLEPRIVLPHASADWSPEHRVAVLAHEHGHVVRRDYVRLAGSTLLGVVLGACPAFAWSLRRQRRDVEQAADAVAVRSVAPRAYAQALLDLGRVPASVPAA